MPGLADSRTVPLFPTCVFAHAAADAAPLNQKLLRRIARLRRDQPLWKGRPRPWQSQPDLHTRAGFRPLVDLVRDAVGHAATELRWELPATVITGMWANVLGRGEPHPPHAHGNNLFSGVYYVQCPEPDAAKLTFYHPNRAADVWRPAVREWTLANSTSWSFAATEGRLLLFPSWLLHTVAPVAHDGERVSVAFNVAPRGPLNLPDSLQHADFSERGQDAP